MANEYLIKLSPTANISDGKLMFVRFSRTKSSTGTIAPVLIQQDLSGNTVTSSGVRKKAWDIDVAVYYTAAPDGFATYQHLEDMFAGTGNAFAFQDMRGDTNTYTVSIINKGVFSPKPLDAQCFKSGAIWEVALELRET